jgi:hypothetical protein
VLLYIIPGINAFLLRYNGSKSETIIGNYKAKEGPPKVFVIFTAGVSFSHEKKCIIERLSLTISLHYVQFSTPLAGYR